MKNELSNLEYGGSYEIIISVKEEDMEKFIEEVEKKLYLVEKDEELKTHKIVFKNIMGRELGENAVIYERIGCIRRRIINIFKGKPKNVYWYVIYSKYIEGTYEIKMVYHE